MSMIRPELRNGLSSQLGVTVETLLEFVHDSDVEVPPPIDVVITNSLVLELYSLMNSHHKCTFYTLRGWLKWLMQSEWPPSEVVPTVNSIRQSVLRLSMQLSKLRKDRQCRLKEQIISAFLNEPYSLPVPLISNPARGQSSGSSFSSCSSDELLKIELSQCKANSKALEEKLAVSRKKMYSLNRNTTKKVKRRDDKIAFQASEITKTSEHVSQLQKKVTRCDKKITQLKYDKDRLRHKISYWRKQVEFVTIANGEVTDELTLRFEDAQKMLIDRMNDLEEKNIELVELVDELMATSTEISTFAHGKYNDDVRLCCYELLSLNVGVRNVKPVILSVLKHLAEKTVSRLPSKALLCDMMVESLTLAQAQLSEELSSDDIDHHTIQTDGTSKFGQHYNTYDIATNEQTYTLGLRHVFSGSSRTTLETLKEILEDLDVVHVELHGTSEIPISSKIITKIKNTMSDRHSAEKLFNELLADYRSEILPEIYSGWDELQPNEKDQLERMNNFFCGLHYLVGLADAAEASLCAWESTFDEEIRHSQSSGTQRLIRTACKAFHYRGSEQAGCSTKFRSFLRLKGILDLPLASFHGNRFNILFYDAAGVYFLHKHMLMYLTEAHGSCNRLLQSVLSDLKTPSYIAACRALGIIDKIVTGPFWRFLQVSTVSILDMSNTYTRMVEMFDEWANEADLVMDGKAFLFDEDRLDSDPVANVLFLSSENDYLVQEVLQLLFKAFAITTKRLLLDHLPGGAFHGVTDAQIIAETSSVPKTNVNPERDFAILDRLLREKPNATYIALEAVLLFSHNKTSNWLDDKSSDEKERLIQAARKLTTVHRLNFRKRRDEINSKRIAVIEEKEEELRKKREKAVREKEKITKEIQKIGLWTDNVEIAKGLQMFSSRSKKLAALKLQINFRKKVLGQIHQNKSVFNFSHSGRPYTVDELTNNLFQLLPLREQPLSAEDVSQDPYSLVYRRIEHLFISDGELQWYNGTVLGFNPETSEYRVVYDGEDKEYNFNLVDDLLNRELIVC